MAPVDRAVVTHAHSDHAYRGNKRYLVVKEGEELARIRLDEDALIKTQAYGKKLDIDGVKVSFHPAGHILGSSQVRVEFKGEVWVVSGDYKLTPDPTCAPSSLSNAITLLPRRRSACRSIDGRRRSRCSVR